METKEQIKQQLRAMTAEQIEAQKEECQMIITHASATADDRAEARLILQAVEELEQQHQERKQAAEEIASTIERAGRKIADERQARIIARAMQIDRENQTAARINDPDEQNALAILELWNTEGVGIEPNIFAGISETDFLDMVHSRDFTRIKNQCNNIKALQFSLHKIAQAIYGRNGKEKRVQFLTECNAFLRLKDDVRDWSKRVNFPQYRFVFWQK